MNQNLPIPSITRENHPDCLALGILDDEKLAPKDKFKTPMSRSFSEYISNKEIEDTKWVEYIHDPVDLGLITHTALNWQFCTASNDSFNKPLLQRGVYVA